MLNVSSILMAIILKFFYLAVAASALPSLRFAISPLFASGIDELLFVLVYFIWFYFEIINQVFIAFKNKNATILMKNDRLSMLVIYLGVIGCTFIAGYFGSLRIDYHFAELPIWTFYLGLGVMLFGESLRQWSIYTLGRFFTFPVVILSDHKLITRGPYKLIRHPSYLGGAIMVAGIGLAMRSWIAPFVVFAIMLIVYSYRIHFEEKTLRRYFGTVYDDYAKRTARIIPHLL